MMRLAAFRGPAPGQRGQALIEAVVTMLLLVPLFFAIHLMWAWQDARHAALVAARYVAFDAALGMPAQEGRSAREALGQHVLNGRRRGWVSLGASGIELIDDAGVRVGVLPWALPGSLMRTESTAFALLAPALALGSGALDLQRGGGLRSEVTLPARALLLPGSFGQVQGPRLEASLAVLGDPWRASGAAVGHGRVASLSAAGRTREWVEPLRGVREALALIEPAFERLCLGRIDVDVVPADRLVGSVAGPLDLRQRACP